MNIKEIIINELKDKEYDKLTSSLYVYLRLCELLSYDYEHLYNAKLRDQKMHEFYEFNYENNNDYLVNCVSFHNVFNDILTELDIDFILRKNKHAYTIVILEDYELWIDPWIKELSDIARVKEKMEICGFGINVIDDCDMQNIIEEPLAKIGYNSSFNKEMLEILKEEINKCTKLEKIEKLKGLINKGTLGYCEGIKYIKFLFNDILKINYEDLRIIREDEFRVAKLYEIKVEDGFKYLIYYQEDKKFILDFITEEEMSYYVDNYVKIKY